MDFEKAINALRLAQNQLASSRDRCDESEGELWDTYEAAIAALSPFVPAKAVAWMYMRNGIRQATFNLAVAEFMTQSGKPQPLYAAPPANDEAKALKDALRSMFPEFQGDEPVTPEAIRSIGNEYLNMIYNWAPVQTEIEFTDQDGAVRKIVHEDGEPEVGLSGGWTIPEDADWQVTSANDEAVRLTAVRDELSAQYDTPAPYDDFNRGYYRALGVALNIVDKALASQQEEKG